MDKKEIRKVLRNPYKELVNVVLDFVNLTEQERKAIELCEINGYTEEKASEIMTNRNGEQGLEIRYFRRIKKSAINKISIVFATNKLANVMLEM